MKFRITNEMDQDKKYMAECSDLLGYLSEGDKLEEALKSINEAIRGCLKSDSSKELQSLAFDWKLDISIGLDGN